MARITLTDDVIGELERLKRETGLGPQALLRGRADIPKGLTASAIDGWLRGTTHRASEIHLEYALNLWRSVTPRVKITREHIAAIKGHSARTGVAWRALISLIDPLPDGLNGYAISQWVNGHVRSARQDHMDAVLKTLESLPDARFSEPCRYQGRLRFEDRREFTEEDRLALEKERERTGISQGELLKYFYRGKVPDALTSAMITGWINRKPKTVPAALYEWTLKAWKALPDAD
ncbi:hypothetical protein [Hyphobacterium sp.]|uniref:hypothetical protein n=1 Tax=Hyphobacterium sp. TaxID=2004662 RepID=UPI003BA90BB7